MIKSIIGDFVLNNYTKYTQELNLLNYDVYHECNPYNPEYFDVQNILDETFGYGKHTFTIGIMDPTDWMDSKLTGLTLKENSKILFEIVDYHGNIIHSGLSTISHVNGTSFAWFNILQDMSGTYYEVANGPAKLVIVGELAGNNLPDKYKKTYNIRTQIPFYISKN